jgi:aminoglycoside 6'-N-acetyltransferase I
MRAYRSTPAWAVFVADRGDDHLGAFLELDQREMADGCATSPVPYIEGWYVDQDLRRMGVGRALVRAAERHAQSAGFTEIASDCVLDNEISRLAHASLGYEEVHRSIHFRRSLTGGC